MSAAEARDSDELFFRSSLQSRLRTSPRSTTPPTTVESPEAKNPPASEFNALSLSLQVMRDEFNLEMPAPLETIDPDSLAEKRQRKSTECTADVYRSANGVSSESIELKSEPALSRKCPEIPVEKFGPELELNLLEWRGSGKKRCHSEGNSVSKRCFRPRTVLMSDSSEELLLRRSPRFLSTKSKLMALAETPPLSVKRVLKKAQISCQRSNLSVEQNGFKEDTEFNPALIKMPVVLPGKKPWEEINCGLQNSEEFAMKTDLMTLHSDMKQMEEIEGETEGTFGKSLRSLFAGAEDEDSKMAIEFLSPDGSQQQNSEARSYSEKKMSKSKSPCSFVGEPVPEAEALQRWGWRYDLKMQNQKLKRHCWKLNAGEEDEIILNVKCHYTQAKVNSCIINVGDCAFIKGDGKQKHVGRILEFFETTDGDDYFRVQWFYRAEDTVMQNQAASHDKKRLFYSTLLNDNVLDCLISKVHVIQTALRHSLRKSSPYDFYYDMEYCVEYSTFRTLSRDDTTKNVEISAPEGSEAPSAIITTTPSKDMPSCEPYKGELALLDLYAGCGGMSTGLCLGARISSVNLVTRWAVDADRAACDSLKVNHPKTQVRKQKAEDFLELLKGWKKLCKRYVLDNSNKALRSRAKDVEEGKRKGTPPTKAKISSDEYEVHRLVDIGYGDPCKTGKRGLKFKVRWKGYSSRVDTWEPIEGLRNCQERIVDFVRSGYKSKILPLPGDVDVLCGGPPCQGISGYNRHRNIDSPLTDERNRQLIMFMDIVDFLRPKYVLMENVNDILKFDKASLGRYAVSRLVHMKYQTRLGTMASGCYGLPQFRLRVFLWGALPSEKLPQFPLPSHDVVVRYWPATEFERNTVAYDEGQHRDLEEAVVLRDAISDLPAVTCNETREQMPYEMPPETEFQKFIRLTKHEMMGLSSKGFEDASNNILYDHLPCSLSEDDYLRVCQIPHKKGANFRDLPGVIVGPDNVVHRDPNERPRLPSGNPLVPNSAFTYELGKSKRPYARVWWDETVATLVTYPHIRAQAVLHPEQDRTFTIRECARLQGFPDYYRFCGTIKERYRQVGNAVSVPVARALGYCLGMASRKLGGDGPLLTLPSKFAFQRSPTEKILLS